MNDSGVRFEPVTLTIPACLWERCPASFTMRRPLRRSLKA